MPRYIMRNYCRRATKKKKQKLVAVRLLKFNGIMLSIYIFNSIGFEF